jgi:hypothetical protein
VHVGLLAYPTWHYRGNGIAYCTFSFAITKGLRKIVFPTFGMAMFFYQKAPVTNDTVD